MKDRDDGSHALDIRAGVTVARIVDPASGDAEVLRGVTTAQLTADKQDITFHA